MLGALIEACRSCFDALADMLARARGRLARAERPTLSKGTRVRVVRRLAEGGFSYVDLAVDAGGGARAGREYALKRVRCGDAEGVGLARHEIAVHEAFSHAHLMPLVDWAVPDARLPGEALLLFPLVDGGSLRGAIDARLCLDHDLDATVGRVRQDDVAKLAACALAQAHQATRAAAGAAADDGH